MDLSGVLRKIQTYLDESGQVRLAEYYEEIKQRTARTETQIRKVLGGQEEEIVRVIHLQPGGPTDVFIQFLAFDGQINLADRLVYYDENAKWRYIYYSRENYEKYKREGIEKYCRYIEKKEYWLGYGGLLFFHEVQRFLEEGLRLCVDDRNTRDSWFVFNKRNLAFSIRAWQIAYLFLTLGLYDRTRHYLGILREQLATLKSSRLERNQRHARLFDGMTDFLEQMVLAHEATDAEQGRWHAARAILAQFRAVVENWADQPEESREYRCSDLILSICAAIEYDFDPMWAPQCYRVLLPRITAVEYHPVYFKAQPWDAWMSVPEEQGWMSTERLFELQGEIMREKFKRS